MARYRLHGYAASPDFAWQGWRLRIPGTNPGGEYHGFIAPDSASGWPAGRDEIGADGLSGYKDSIDTGSAGPWQKDIWGGMIMGEVDNLSDHVYRSPGEMRPRPNASGGVNTVRSHQTMRSAGYAIAPGNYRSLGALDYGLAMRGPLLTNGGGGSMIPVRYLGPPVARPPLAVAIGPAMAPPQNGATATVAQPPPPGYPVSSPSVPVYSVPPISPAPAPTVAASPSDFVPSQGQTVPGITPGTTPSVISAIQAWLNSSSVITGVSNWWIAAGIGAALLMFSGQASGGGRKR
jgi:hypothetical protein